MTVSTRRGASALAAASSTELRPRMVMLRSITSAVGALFAPPSNGTMIVSSKTKVALAASSIVCTHGVRTAFKRSATVSTVASAGKGGDGGKDGGAGGDGARGGLEGGSGGSLGGVGGLGGMGGGVGGHVPHVTGHSMNCPISGSHPSQLGSEAANHAQLNTPIFVQTPHVVLSTHVPGGNEGGGGGGGGGGGRHTHVAGQFSS